MTDSEYHKEWYNKNKEKRQQQIYARRREIRNWFREYKKSLKCTNCPEDYWACLDFHHHNDDKDEGIDYYVRNGCSKKRILAEINKCIVLCSNCHRKLHNKEDTR